MTLEGSMCRRPRVKARDRAVVVEKQIQIGGRPTDGLERR
jgi:hypothetical protein